MGKRSNPYSLRRKAGSAVIILICSIVVIGMAYVLFNVYKPSQNAMGALATVGMDVVGLLILVILVLNLAFGKDFLSKISTLFLGLLLGTLVGLFFDFLNWAFDGMLEYGGLTYVFTVCSLCTGSVVAGFFVLYLGGYFEEMYRLKHARFMSKFCMYWNIGAFLFAIIAVVTNTAFVFDNGHYEIGPLYDIVMILPILTLVFMLIYSVINVKKIGAHDFTAVVGYIFIMIFGAEIEEMYTIGTTYVSIMVADVFIFAMLQNRLIDKVNRQNNQLTEKVTEEKKNAEHWMQKSNTDELTGCYNRHAYEEEVMTLSEDQIKENFVYISVDVNGLKLTNDTLGHDAGDELIIGTSECLNRCLGDYGKIYRTGGDEFVALVYVNNGQLEEIKKDIEDTAERWHGRYNKHLTISIGFVTRKEAENMTLHQIAVLADKRMYESKTRYYRKSGVDRRGQRDAHVALCSLYTKILKINVTDDSYQLINVREDEKTEQKGFSDKLSVWLMNYGTSGEIHPEDVEEYLAKTGLEYLRGYFKRNSNSLRVFYRRKINGVFRKVMLEIIPANDYQDDSQSLFLYVKDIE